MGDASKILVSQAAVYIESPAADGSGYAQAGYLADAVEYSYEPSVTDIEVHEETTPVSAVIDKEKNTITLPFAEADLSVLDLAMVGSSLAADTITLGGGAVKYVRVKLVTPDPDNSGKYRKIEFFRMVSTGGASLKHSRTEKMAPSLTLTAYKDATYGVGQIVRNLAAETD